MPVRIYDIAKKLGLQNKEIIRKAKELGIIAAQIPSSQLDKITAEYLENEIVQSQKTRRTSPISTICATPLTIRSNTASSPYDRSSMQVTESGDATNPQNTRSHMNSPESEEVSPAFEILLESVELEVNKLNELGGEAFKKRDYARAKNLADQAQSFTSFRMKVLSLSSEWEKLRAGAAPAPAAPQTNPDRKVPGKLRKGMRTPETAFYRPLLEVLVAVGGGGEMSRVLDSLYPKIASLLKPVDEQHLPSGPKTGPRWRNTAQWARNTLKQHGYLKPDSAHGIWEITDAGRKWLEKSKTQGGSMPL